ncbi:ArsR/SmtB family transcription factor [Teredinibacter haidensis]|uniref:ArsR/SmtB family transcription factor n=1 Tax=Teredinibacter haidensis TaxID=2731755 RepID=UPI0009489825|nr:metalloregulator ArsR/SmtB family transcription factor [Teredinibacter haidensis]
MPSSKSIGERETVALTDVEQHVDSAANLLKSLANPNRLLVLCVLAGKGGEMCVSELNACIDLSQSALSQHLARLRTDNLVQTRRDSQTIYYSINSGPALQLIQVLQQYYCQK